MKNYTQVWPAVTVVIFLIWTQFLCGIADSKVMKEAPTPTFYVFNQLKFKLPFFFAHRSQSKVLSVFSPGLFSGWVQGHSNFLFECRAFSNSALQICFRICKPDRQQHGQVVEVFLLVLSVHFEDQRTSQGPLPSRPSRAPCSSLGKLMELLVGV